MTKPIDASEIKPGVYWAEFGNLCTTQPHRFCKHIEGDVRGWVNELKTFFPVADFHKIIAPIPSPETCAAIASGEKVLVDRKEYEQQIEEKFMFNQAMWKIENAIGLELESVVHYDEMANKIIMEFKKSLDRKDIIYKKNLEDWLTSSIEVSHTDEALSDKKIGWNLCIRYILSNFFSSKVLEGDQENEQL